MRGDKTVVHTARRQCSPEELSLSERDAFIDLAGELAAALRSRNLDCATAESCTAGLVGHIITLVAGSSDYYQGGVVAYSNRAKQDLLQVSPSTLASVGAVSSETAIEMARGARKALHAGVGIATTGIAGPGGATARKPVGLIYIAVSSETGDEVRELRLQGSRVDNIEQTAVSALRLALDHISNLSDG